MKAITSNIVKGIPLGSRLVCADNSGAKELELIAVKGYKGRLRRLPKAGVGDVIICSVKKGKEKIRKTVVYAVVVRQKKEYMRMDGSRVKFEDNAAILVNPKTFEPQGTEIRTVIAKEAVERFSAIGKIASVVL
ncbi:MAG: 50S ribosomal protein L14 [Candidatus Aenigmarchaeota archaeon]|nr:50S ribosomal protein L14 [Candidatus Aenigmarchaeota archaeon]